MKAKVFMIAILTMTSIFSCAQPKIEMYAEKMPPKPFYSFWSPEDEKSSVNESSLIQIDKSLYYYKDSTNVYYKYVRDIGSARAVIVTSFHKIENADLKSFRVIEYRYTADNNYVYYDGFVIVGADPNTFERLEYDYSKDANHIYFMNCPIEGADMESFNIAILPWLNYAFAYDKHYLYYAYQKVKIDGKTFQIGQDKCADKNYIYYIEGNGYDGKISWTKK